MDAKVAIDLHIHSTLSPCGAEEMLPPQVLLTAERRGIAVVGIVDHCCARNAWAFMEAAPAFEVRVFVGLEVESAENVHLLALFDSVAAAMEMDRIVSEHLPPLKNRADLFGRQNLVDEWGESIGVDDRLLITATDLSVERVAGLTHELGGMSIAAHVDRSANGLLRILGFVPPKLQVDVFEISASLSVPAALARYPDLLGRPLITAGDAHCLADIGRAVTTISRDLAEAQVDAAEWGRRLAEEVGGGA